MRGSSALHLGLVRCPRIFLRAWGLEPLFCTGLEYNATPNFLTFVKTTAIAYGQKIDQSLRIFVVCNSSRFYKRQPIGSRVDSPEGLPRRQDLCGARGLNVLI